MAESPGRLAAEPALPLCASHVSLPQSTVFVWQSRGRTAAEQRGGSAAEQRQNNGRTGWNGAMDDVIGPGHAHRATTMARGDDLAAAAPAEPAAGAADGPSVLEELLAAGGELLTPSLVVLDKHDGRGRGVYAATPLRAGTEVFQAEPFAVGVPEYWHRNVCVNCMTFDCRRKLPVTCEQCRVASFCNEACRDLYRDAHRLECVLLSQLRGRIAKLSRDWNFPNFRTRLRTMAIFYARVMALLEQEGTLDATLRYGPGGGQPLPLELVGALATAAAVTPPRPSLADAVRLVSNYDKYKADEDLMLVFKEGYKIMRSLLPEPVLGGSADDFVSMLCREECNSFGFWDDGDEMYAYGLFPSASYFNHSCCPNVCKTTRGRSLFFRAIRDIAAGEELTISYVLLNDSTEMRQAALKSSYLFTCTCPRCSLPEGAPDEFLVRYVHHCGGPVYVGYGDEDGQRICSKCDARLPPLPDAARGGAA